MQMIRSIDEWRTIISDCRASDLSDREWCSEHDIPLSTFYYKIKKLREQACFIPDHTGNKAVQTQEIVPLLVEDEMVLEMAGKHRGKRGQPIVQGIGLRTQS